MEHNGIESLGMKTPNSEVVALKLKRHRYTAEYKLRILKEADLCQNQDHGVGELLRREGIYSSMLAHWRKQRDEGILSLFSKKRGPKPRYSETQLEVIRLTKENARLTKRLEQAQWIIEAQKKIAEILSAPEESLISDEDKS